MAKISTFIITLIVMSMIVGGGYTAYMASISTNYNPGDYNKSKLDSYNKLAEIKEDTDEIENKTIGIAGTQSGVADILGGFFQAGYNAIALSFSSYEIFYDMASTARDDIPNLDAIGIYFIGATVIVVIILIFIILRVVVKGDV